MTGSGRDRGQATVELALVLPVVALLLLLVAQVVVVAHRQVLVVHAAREAGRAGAVAPAAHQVAEAARRGAERAGGLDPGRLSVRTALDGGHVRVEVAYAEPTDVAVVGALLPSLTLEAGTTTRWEGGDGP